MATELHVFLESAKLPTHDVWQAAISSLGFPAVLEVPFDPRSDRGFRPVAHSGDSTGFEFYLDSANAIADSYPHVSDEVGHRDLCATFRWGGDLKEMSSALAAAATLAKLTNGIYYYPDDDVLYNGDQAVDATKADLNLP